MKRKPLKLDDTVLLHDIALDDEHVIVASQQLNLPKLFIVNYDGTARRPVVPATKPDIQRVVADSRGIFTAGDAGICRVDKSGKVKQLAKQRPWTIEIDEEFIYASIMGRYPDYKDGGVIRVPRGGGEIEWLVTGQMVSALCVAGGVVYFATNGTLHRRRTNGAIETLASVKNPHAITQLGDSVAWTEFDDAGAPRRLHGGEVRSLGAQSYTSDMLVIGDWLYWSQSSRKKTTPAIWRMRLGDAEPEPVVKFAGSAPRIAGNERLLCWIGDNNGGVYALPT